MNTGFKKPVKSKIFHQLSRSHQNRMIFSILLEKKLKKKQPLLYSITVSYYIERKEKHTDSDDNWKILGCLSTFLFSKSVQIDEAD